MNDVEFGMFVSVASNFLFSDGVCAKCYRKKYFFNT